MPYRRTLITRSLFRCLSLVLVAAQLLTALPAAAQPFLPDDDLPVKPLRTQVNPAAASSSDEVRVGSTIPYLSEERRFGAEPMRSVPGQGSGLTALLPEDAGGSAASLYLTLEADASEVAPGETVGLTVMVWSTAAVESGGWPLIVQLPPQLRTVTPGEPTAWLLPDMMGDSVITRTVEVALTNEIAAASLASAAAFPVRVTATLQPGTDTLSISGRTDSVLLAVASGLEATPQSNRVETTQSSAGGVLEGRRRRGVGRAGSVDA